MSILVTLIALLLEAFFGYPDRLLRAIGHPVTWIGRLIDDLDRLLNREAATDATRRHAGALALLILVGTVGALAYIFEYNLTALPFGYLGEFWVSRDQYASAPKRIGSNPEPTPEPVPSIIKKRSLRSIDSTSSGDLSNIHRGRCRPSS